MIKGIVARIRDMLETIDELERAEVEDEPSTPST
jgi:hypothetical protein